MMSHPEHSKHVSRRTDRLSTAAYGCPGRAVSQVAAVAKIIAVVFLLSESQPGWSQEWVPRSQNPLRTDVADSRSPMDRGGTSAHASQHDRIQSPLYVNAAPPHLVLQAPQHGSHQTPGLSSHFVPPPETDDQIYHSGLGNHSGPQHLDAHATIVGQSPRAEKKATLDLSDHLPIHANKQTRPVAIHQTVRAPVWKQPYSYGHFGAAHTRQWSLHHGHQQKYSQWTLR